MMRRMSVPSRPFAGRRQEILGPPRPDGPVERPRPDGLIERLPALPPPCPATYAKADGAPAGGDRRRRRRAREEPWRGRFVDLVG